MTPLPIQSVEVNGWIAYDHPDPPADQDGNIWVWETISGWFGNLPVRGASIDRPMMDGAYDGPAPFGGRTIEVGGTLVAPTRAALQHGLDKLAGVLARNIRRAQFTVDEGVVGLIREASVRLGGPTMIERTGPISATWSLSLFAADPLRYSQQSHSYGLYPATEGQGRVYDLIHDRHYGPIGSSGRARIWNAGNASVAPVITFIGPSTNPRLRIIDGDKIQLAMDIPDGKRVIVDCYSRTITMDGVSKRQYMTPDSRWLQFWYGATDIYYDTDAGNGLCNVAWKDAWI
jgi:hypothetical protein